MDPTLLKRFVVGVDKARMKLYNVDPKVQEGLHRDVDSGKAPNHTKPAAPERYGKAKAAIETDDWDYE